MSKAAAAEIDSSSVPDAWPGDDLSIQYSAGSCYPAALEPEIRLMTMVLEDTVNCFQRFAGADGNPDLGEFRDAERWLFGAEKDWIFSFENICAFLGLDPRYIRSGLRLWQGMNQHPDLDASARRRGCGAGASGVQERAQKFVCCAETAPPTIRRHPALSVACHRGIPNRLFFLRKSAKWRFLS